MALNRTIRGKKWLLLDLTQTHQEQLNDVTTKLEGGEMGWGDAKKLLGEYMESYFGSMSAEYFRLMDNPDEIRAILRDGAEKVRPIATENMARIRATMGII